jgi:hypothetical protein
MPQNLTGTNTTDPGLTPTAVCPADGDPANVATVNGPFQTLLNAIGYLRKNAVIGSITRALLPAVGQQVSGSSGAYAIQTTINDVPNLSVTLVTTGRPVVLTLQQDGGAGLASLSATSGVQPFLYLLRDGTIIAKHTAQPSGGSVTFPLPSMHCVDAPSAASHTYKIQAYASGSGAVLSNCSLVAFEL